MFDSFYSFAVMVRVRTSSSLKTLFTGSLQDMGSSPEVNTGQGLFPDAGDESLPDEGDYEDERASLVALETELQKYLHES